MRTLVTDMASSTRQVRNVPPEVGFHIGFLAGRPAPAHLTGIRNWGEETKSTNRALENDDVSSRQLGQPSRAQFGFLEEAALLTDLRLSHAAVEINRGDADRLSAGPRPSPAPETQSENALANRRPRALGHPGSDRSGRRPKQADPISRQRIFDARSNIRFHFRRKFAPDSIDASDG